MGFLGGTFDRSTGQMAPFAAAGGHAHDGVLCWLDGVLHDVPVLRRALGLAPGTPLCRLLVEGFREHGEALLERLRGEFALCLWDVRGRTGLVARDQLGVRSVFLRATGPRLAFASDLPLLLDETGAPPAPDEVALAAWLATGTTPPGRTLYDGVSRLAPGGLIRLGNGGFTEHRWWQPVYATPERVTREEAAEQVRDVLDVAVRRRTAGCSSVGVLLSGGLDSGGVASLAAPIARGEGAALGAWSATFRSRPSMDESALIELQASRLGIDSHQEDFTDASLLPAALRYADDRRVPLPVPAHSLWEVVYARAARAGVDVMLDGEGGDQLFDARTVLIADRARSGRLLSAIALGRRYPGAGPAPGPRTIARILRAELGAASAPPGDGPLWWRGLVHDVTALPESYGMFEYFRHRAAAAGVRAGHPFFDVDLVELVLRLPPEMAFDGTLSRRLLRDAMRGLVPDEVRLRRDKTFFDSLVADALEGPDLAFVGAVLGGEELLLEPWVDRRAVNALVDGSVAAQGRGSRSRLRDLWRLVTAECWLRSQCGLTVPRPARESDLFGSSPTPALT